ncbi:MAG: GIY-YIG nuclease family protein, partial [Desulfovibrionales bacterium]|nr:GIY-YIG nuclease family protein [Desulfovibrionales bacterium]
RLEKEMQKAMKDEEKYQKLLKKAQTDAEKETGVKLSKLQTKIAQLSQELQEANNRSERAKSMAQQTKLGHVYIISNIGSFGENVYKIGMTRRLEPLDRVKELGDASVPFIFDVHAMIYSEDAPALEKKLHSAFNSQRLNLVNNRKEFFNVSLADIEKEVNKTMPNIEFIKTAEARDYRETQAKRAFQNQKNNIPIEFPEAI